MNEFQYNLWYLWPDFNRVLSWDYDSPAGLSAIVVSFLIVVALSFFSLSLWNFFRAKQHVAFYRELIHDLKVEELLEKRRDIVKKALENQPYGKLWKEFDESLVHVPEKRRLCNTLDAEHFFNTQSLARGLTENRLTAAVPGFLTAIGVIGTFAGLLLGLAELDVTSEDIDTLKGGVAGLIGGASIAFMTSVWGVFTSVMFNFLEKLLERGIRSDIKSFQSSIDYLYPRITAEQSLSNIEEYSRQSTEKLAELDEKIGHKMQEAMREASAAISDSLMESLSSLLGPAIDRLVTNAQSGSEKALESLLDRFMSGVGSAGESQRAMMRDAAAEFTEASSGISAELQGFLGKLDNQIADMTAQNKSILENLERSLQSRIENQNTADSQRQQAAQEQMNGFMSAVEFLLQKTHEQSVATVNELQAAQTSVNQSVSDVVETQRAQSESVLSKLDELLGGFEKLTKSHLESSVAIHKSTENMKSTATQFGLLSVNLKESAEQLSANLGEAVRITNETADRNSEVSQVIEHLLGMVEEVRQGLSDTSKTLAEAAEMADGGLSAVGEHFDSLAVAMKKQIEDLESKTSDFLTSYTEKVISQTNERLNVWNEQTSNYTAAMTDAVNALSSVVDEIEMKNKNN